ncbi:hypothetical protein Tco_1193404 [Tanacetum coccineum]
MNPIATQQVALDNALVICLILPNQEFVKPPFDEEFIQFIQELGYSGKCDMLFAIHTDQMHQPWRTFAAMINRCISRKTTSLDRLRSSRAQILWELFYQKNVDYYGALIPDEMLNQDIKDSKAYKTYLDFATRKATPKKSRKFKKVTSPSKKLSPVLEEEPAKKPKQAKKPATKSTTMTTSGVLIRDTPGVSVSKKKAPAKDSHMLHASGSGDGVGSQPKVPNESQDKTTGTNEGTGTKPGVPDVPKDLSKSENESWRDSDDDDSNDDVSNDDDDDVDSDADGDNKASDSEKTDSDEEENTTLNLKGDEEEEYKDEYVHTPEHDEFYDDEDDIKFIKQVVDDAYVTLTTAHVTQKTEGPMQSSSVSSDFASKFLNLDNVLPADNKVASMMNVDVSLCGV